MGLLALTGGIDRVGLAVCRIRVGVERGGVADQLRKASSFS